MRPRISQIARIRDDAVPVREIGEIRGQKSIRLFRGRVRTRNGRSALQNASRKTGGVLTPFVLCIPGSGLSFRHSRGDYGTVRNGQKTYGSVIGTIFFGGVGSSLAVEGQWVAKGKVPTNWENAKKSGK
jgi:hypothetical protein